MSAIDPLATGMLEATCLALLGVLLFQLRRRAGLIPFLFLLGSMAIALPMLSHTAPSLLAQPWTVGQAYIVVLPVFMALVLLLHTLTGVENARIAASMPVLAGAGGALIAAVAPHVPIGLPDALVPVSGFSALVTGASIGAAAAGATILFEWWHREVGHQSPLALVLTLSALAGLLFHGLLTSFASLGGVPLPGAAWPAIVASPLLAGAGPVLLVALYADTLVVELSPIARKRLHRHRLLGEPIDLEVYREADARLHVALEQGQEAAQTYEDLTDPNPGQAVALCDRQGRIVHANEALLAILELGEDEVVGQDAQHLLFGPHTRTAAQPAETARRFGPRDRVVWGDGEQPRVLEITATELVGRGLRLEVADVTEETLRARLEDQAARTRFALDLLSREVPNYLVTSVSSLELLEESLAPALDEDGHRRLARARACLDDLSGRLRRLTSLTGEQVPDLQPVSATRLLREIVEANTGDDEHRPGLSVRWQLPEDPLRVQAEPELVSVFRRLVENAIHHAGPEPRLTLWAEREHGGWTIGFDDDGPGIPPALRERALAGQVRSKDGRGRGLGLTVASLLVERMGGRLWIADREAGQPGASLRLWLPGAVGEPVEAGDPASEDLSSGSGTAAELEFSAVEPGGRTGLVDGRGQDGGVASA